MRTHRYHRVSVSHGYSIGMFECSCQLCAGIRAHENVAMYGMLIVKVQEMKDYVLEQSIRIILNVSKVNPNPKANCSLYCSLADQDLGR